MHWSCNKGVKGLGVKVNLGSAMKEKKEVVDKEVGKN